MSEDRIPPIEELWQIVQEQGAELARLREQRRGPSSVLSGRPISRAGLLKAAAAGAVVTTLGAELGGPATALADGTEGATTFSTSGSIAVSVQCTSPNGTGVGVTGPGASELSDYWGVASDVTNGIGVRTTSANGTALFAYSDGTATNATAVFGQIGSTSPGGFSSAVRGQNNGTGGLGIGVWGSQAGSGWGGYFTSAGGIGVNASGGSGTGVNASGATGVTASGTTIGVAASGGRGVVASGSAAQLQLTPGSGSSHPASGAAGDFYVDSSARLWFCQGGTTWFLLTLAKQGPTGPEGPTGSQGLTGPEGPAATRLIPSSRHRPPRSGKAGELFVDSSPRLWFCKRGGSRARWEQIG